MVSQLLGIYLNDHLAGATAGTELARRISGRHGELRDLAQDVADDRLALLRLMRELDVPVRRHKAAAGWLAGKLGRIKPNGRLLSRSPLSDLVELETMRLGIEGKATLWRAVRELKDVDTAALDRLSQRAESQARVVEDARIRAAVTAFSSPAAGVDVTRTFTVGTTPDAVAEYLRDFSRTEQWDPGTVSCTRIDTGPVAVGARWRNVSKFLGKKTELVYVLTRSEPDRLMFVGTNKSATSTDDISFSAGKSPGTTEIAYHAHVEFNGLAKLGTPVAKVAMEKLGSDTEKSLTRILGTGR